MGQFPPTEYNLVNTGSVRCMYVHSTVAETSMMAKSNFWRNNGHFALSVFGEVRRPLATSLPPGPRYFPRQLGGHMAVAVQTYDVLQRTNILR